MKLDKAVEKAFPEKSGCIIETLRYANISDRGQLRKLGAAVGAPIVCGINVNVLVAGILKELDAPEEDVIIDQGEVEDVVVNKAVEPIDGLGLQANHLAILKDNGVEYRQDVLELGVSGLEEMVGLGHKSAEAIFALANKEN